MSEDVKYLLPENRIPKAWYNIAADLPQPLPPPLHPGTAKAGRAGRSCADFPDGADRAGSVGRARDRDPRAGARRLQAVAAVAALPRAPSRAPARYPGAASTTNMRASRRPAATSPTPRSPQAFYNQARPASGSSRPRPAPGSGAPRSPSPAQFFGLEVQSLHGQGELRPKALPARADGDLWRHRASPARATRPTAGRAILAEVARIRPAASASPSRKRSKSRPRTPTPKYALGWVLNHVLMHQTVIGIEAIEQMEMAGD